MRVLVTGGAGSIGVHVVKALLVRGDEVSIVDSFNNFYDPLLKRKRLDVMLKGLPVPAVFEKNIVDEVAMRDVFAKAQPEGVIHLAGWAAVRPSMAYPMLYTQENVDGTVNIFEQCVEYDVKRVVFASSSSVYPRGITPPFSEDVPCDMPIAPYAASKRAGELYAWMYNYLHGLPIACLRFFTVYGPWIRPDMATWKFTERILRGETIYLHRVDADGNEVKRDFTYIDDIVSGILAALEKNAGYALYNLGGHDPVPLPRLVASLETALGTKARIEERVLPKEEALITAANVERARRDLGYAPTVSVEEGAKRFVEWYKTEYLPLFPEGILPSPYVS